jgi:hypothetical protein
MSPSAHLVILAAAASLGGCAGYDNITSDVSSYGTWPPSRQPGTYAFERLPSQQGHPDQQAQLEDAARGALARAGFTPAQDAQNADVTVQVGARVTRYDMPPWNDPLWWHGGPYGYRPWRGPYWGAGWGYWGYWGYSYTAYDREVALMLRDRLTGQPLYETRAASQGNYSGGPAVLSAMFDAALQDFPHVALSPRRVSVPVAQ